MENFIVILSWFCFMLGSFLGISGVIGLLRFPDFYTRMHAAGVTDTLCAFLILFGLMLQTDWDIVSIKLLIILIFIFITSPTASHALSKAALHNGLKAKTQSDSSFSKNNNTDNTNYTGNN